MPPTAPITALITKESITILDTLIPISLAALGSTEQALIAFPRRVLLKNR